jgi:hypothetical protein
MKKIIIKTATFILIGLAYSSLALSQNLDSLPQAERDSTLLAIAKKVLLTIGPEYYQVDIAPVISRIIFPKAPADASADDKKDEGRVTYSVIYYYDKTKVEFEYGYLAAVSIWGDTGLPNIVFFGNGSGIKIPNDGIIPDHARVKYEPFDRKAFIEMHREANEILRNPVIQDRIRK